MSFIIKVGKTFVEEVVHEKMNVEKKYVGNSYIFDVTIESILSESCFRTPIDKNDYAGFEIYLNYEEVEKFAKYKEGDTIKICGKIEKIGIYHKIIIKNASIME